jgi:uncharacterized membrane protein
MFDSEGGSAETRNLDRLIALVDGIFAVAMTLLVLDLKLPNDRYVADALLQMLPSFVVYLITFSSIVGYWYMHHSTFQYVARVNGRLIVLSMLGMLFVTLFPLSASIVGTHPLEPMATVCMSLNSALYCLSMWGLWSYLAGHKQLMSPTGDMSRLNRMIRVMGAIGVGLMVAIPLAFVTPFLAYVIWICVPPVVGMRARQRELREKAERAVP